MADEKRKERLLNAQQVQDELGTGRSRGGRKKELNKRQLTQKLVALEKKREWFRTLGGLRRLPVDDSPWAVRILKEYDERIQKLQDEINNL